MRDLILVVFILVSLGASLRYPFVGVLIWAWFTIMTPHQMAYETFGIPLNLIIAAITIVSIFASREAERFRLDTITCLLLFFLAWQTIAQHMSLMPENSAEYYSRFVKTLIFVLVCIQMTTTRLRFHALTWILAGGIAFFAVKGALFTLATLGQYRVQGLPDTILEDNNHFGIAAATVLPMIIYMRGQVANRHLRMAMLGVVLLTLLAIIGTHSRGALVAMIAFGGYLWLKSSYKVSLALAGAAALIPAIMFMPSKWLERMGSISEAGQDASFMGRIDAWIINWSLAKDNPFTGVGLRNSYLDEIAIQSVSIEQAAHAKAAHSIYFEILGGSGFVGLAIFLSMFAFAFLKARAIETSKNPNVAYWHRDFARYAKMSLFIFAIGGASTSMEMWDGYLVIIALIAALDRTIQSATSRKGYARKKSNGLRYRPRSQWSYPDIEGNAGLDISRKPAPKTP